VLNVLEDLGTEWVVFDEAEANKKYKAKKLEFLYDKIRD